jgi:thiol-disulfide isomerase/thioredoxin
MQKNIAVRAGIRRLAVAIIGFTVISTAFAAAAQNNKPPLEGAFGANFTLLEPPIPAPPTAFGDGDGQRTSLRDFRGDVVLVNFWATWCAPCVAEMPSLDRLQADLKPQGLKIVAISQDRRGLDIVQPFYKGLGLDALEIYLDPKGTAAREFQIKGLPTSLLIDRRNRIVGVLQGPAEWDSPEAKALIRYYLDQSLPVSSG